MYKLIASNKFLKDLKLLKKRSGSDFILLKNFLQILSEKGYKGVNQKHKGIDKIYKPHKLKGEYTGYWECHINLIYY